MTALCIICILVAISSIAYAIYTFQHCTKINEENIREMVAFPLASNGADAMMGCPNEVFEKQLRETHIKIRD